MPKVTATGDEFIGFRETTVARSLCVLLLNHLNEESLKEALEDLTDIFGSQVVKNLPPPLALERQVITSKPTIKTVERAPFVFDDQE